MDAFREEERQNELKLIEKQKEKIWSNWKRIIKSLMVRERIKLKYGDRDKDEEASKYHLKKSVSKSKLKSDDLLDVEEETEDQVNEENDQPIFKVKNSPDRNELVEQKPITKERPKAKAKTQKKQVNNKKKPANSKEDDEGDRSIDEEEYNNKRPRLRRKATAKRTNYKVDEIDEEDFEDTEEGIKAKKAKLCDLENANDYEEDYIPKKNEEEEDDVDIDITVDDYEEEFTKNTQRAKGKTKQKQKKTEPKQKLKNPVHEKSFNLSDDENSI